MKKKYAFKPTILISIKEKYLVLVAADIIHIEATGNNTMIYMRDRKSYLDSKRLGQFLEQLDSNMFHRTHRSFAINIFEVMEFDKSRCGNILMSNGLTARFSENEKLNFVKKLRAK